MKLMMKKIGFLCVAFFLVFSLSAQQAGRTNRANSSPEDRANRQTEAMVKQLDLTAEQGAKVKEINLSYAKKMAEAEVNTETRRGKMRELSNARETELQAVLTADQLNKWQEIQKKRRDRTRSLR